jgi:hypothetical protein
MPSLKRLKARLEDLEEEEEEARKKLKWLKKERTVKTDAEAKYELDQRIEEYTERLQEIAEEIEELERQINQSERAENTENSSIEKCQAFDYLYKSLLKLGYWDQHNFFEEIAGKHSYGVFLIQGRSKEDGQKWLLNRLTSIIPSSLEGKNIVIDLNRTASRTDIAAIWDEFSGRVGLPESSLPSEIARKICDLWMSQNVVITFNNADETIEENIGDLINEFWTSLTQILLEDKSQNNMFKLFIFFLDYQGVVSQWNVGFVENYNSNWQPNCPLGLPVINPFSDKDLRDWLNYQSDSLPPSISSNKGETLKVLLDKQGIPIPTFRKICDLCGCNWFEQEGKWLRF